MRPSFLLAFLCLLPAGCGERGGKTGRTEIVFYCGAGLRAPGKKLVALFEKRLPVEVSTDYAGSEILLSRLKLHRRGDLFMPGDAYYVDQAAAAGFVRDRRRLHLWRPVIFVPRGNPAGVRSLADLARPGVRVGLGDPRACAIGKLTRKLIEKAGIPWKKIEKNTSFVSLTVNELALQVQARSLDAVIVWDATARQFSTYGKAIPIPPAQSLVSAVDIAALSCSRHPDLARRLLAIAASPEGKAAFKGF